MENTQFQAEENIDLLKFDKRILFLSLKQKIIFIIIVSFLATALTGIFAKIAIKGKWTSRAILIRHSKNMSSQQDVPYLYQQPDMNTVLQSIKMRKNLNTVIDNLKLNMTPEELFPAIKIEKGKRSNLINIFATHGHRESSAAIANMLSRVFIDSYIEILNSSTRKIYNYYLIQKIEYTQKLNTIKDQLEEFREKNQLLSLEQETQNKYDNLKHLELELMSMQMNIVALQTKIADIDSRLVDMPSQVPLHSTITSTNLKQLKVMKSELWALQEKYTDQNPKVLKLKSEIKALENAIQQESTGEIIADQITYGESQLKQSLMLEQAQYENELNSTREKIKEYDKKISAIKKSLKSISPLEREYFNIKNRQATNQAHLQKINDRLMEAKMAMESNISDFELIEPAVSPKYPAAAHRKLIALMGGFSTFVGLFIFFILKELLDFSVKSEFDFKEFLNIKLLGEIPNKDMTPPTTFYSQMQILYGQLKSILPDKKTPLVVFGNDLPETGSTFILEEIIELFISQNKKILWIESIHHSEEEIEKFIINRNLYQGKSIASENTNKLSDQLHKAYFLCDENIFKRVLDKQQLTGFLQDLDRYDIIFWELFDVNFNLQLFTTITSCSDLLTFVARFRYSNRNQLANAIKFLKENSDVPIAGILNDVRKPFCKLKS